MTVRSACCSASVSCVMYTTRVMKRRSRSCRSSSTNCRCEDTSRAEVGSSAINRLGLSSADHRHDALTHAAAQLVRVAVDDAGRQATQALRALHRLLRTGRGRAPAPRPRRCSGCAPVERYRPLRQQRTFLPCQPFDLHLADPVCAHRAPACRPNADRGYTSARHEASVDLHSRIPPRSRNFPWRMETTPVNGLHFGAKSQLRSMLLRYQLSRSHLSLIRSITLSWRRRFRRCSTATAEAEGDKRRGTAWAETTAPCDPTAPTGR